MSKSPSIDCPRFPEDRHDYFDIYDYRDVYREKDEVYREEDEEEKSGKMEDDPCGGEDFCDNPPNYPEMSAAATALRYFE